MAQLYLSVAVQEEGKKNICSSTQTLGTGEILTVWALTWPDLVLFIVHGNC